MQQKKSSNRFTKTCCSLPPRKLAVHYTVSSEPCFVRSTELCGRLIEHRTGWNTPLQDCWNHVECRPSELSRRDLRFFSAWFAVSKQRDRSLNPAFERCTQTCSQRRWTARRQMSRTRHLPRSFTKCFPTKRE